MGVNPLALRIRTERFKTLVILDEVHHAGDERAWGDGVRTAFELANRRLCLSGTPFRSDTASIPFVRYEETGVGGEAQPDYTYGYADALRDGGVVRPVYFPRFDGLMEWSAPDGSILSANFHDELDRTGASHRLRAALSLQGDWLPAVIDQAQTLTAAMSFSSIRSNRLWSGVSRPVFCVAFTSSSGCMAMRAVAASRGPQRNTAASSSLTRLRDSVPSCSGFTRARYTAPRKNR